MFTTPYFDLIESHLPDPPNLILPLVIAIYVGWAWLLLKIPFLKRLAAAGWHDPSRSRNLLQGLEGIRGLLAFWVVWTHLTSVWMLLNNGVFRAEEGQVRMASIGALAVGFFFPITGFLFWSKLLRSPSLALRTLYIDRLFRILPLFLVVAICTSILIIVDDPHALEQGFTRLSEFVSLFTLGATDTALSPWSHLDIGMAWSLRYEMLFYALLPMLFVSRNVVGPWFFHLSFPIIINYFVVEHYLYFIWGGCLIAEIVAGLPKMSALLRRSLLTSVNLLALPLAAWLAVRGEFWYSYWQLLPISVVILSLVTGSVFNSALNWSPLQTLGRISYSTYLVHGVVIHVIIIATRPFFVFPPAHTFEFALLTTIIMPLVIVVSILTYSLIEVPFMRRGRDFAQRIGKTLSL